MKRYDFVDLHCHLLPGVDDGAKDIETAYRMLRIMADEGVKAVCVTPHQKAHRRSASKEEIVSKVEELQQWIDTNDIDIALHAGNEILYRHEIDSLLEEQTCCTLADTFYVLVEFDPRDDFAYISCGVRKLINAGYYPIIAHIERYDTLAKHKDHIEELIDMGAYMQVNASTIEGKHGFIMKHRVLRWIKEGYVHVVATDSHDTVKRSPGLSKSAAIVEKQCGEEVTKLIYEENPTRVLENKLIKTYGEDLEEDEHYIA